MAFHSRKLIEFSVNETLEISCPPTCVPTPDHCCPESCLRRCPYICFYPLAAPSPPSKSHKPSPTLLVTLLVLASFFLFVTLLFLYVRCYSRRRRAAAARRMNLAADNTREEFINEGHGPVVDHPIWYIRTVGLQPSVISAIAVCKYKKGEGIIEGSDCAVCLSEFFEGETLRLLPKCNHAFHIPCIDTWLRSHTNCPMCRAGIVVEAPAQEAISSGSDSGRGPELRIVDGNEELGDGVGELEDSTTLRVEETQSGLRNGANVSENLKDEVQPMRRSVSMDSLSAKLITVALADVGRVESAGNSNSQSPEIGDSNTGIFPKGDDGNQSLFRVTGGSSSRGRHLQPGPMSLKRSLSCGAKLFLSRYAR